MLASSAPNLGEDEFESAPVVLVIEDDPDMVMLCRLYLRDGGYEVLRAASGSEGLALARSERPAVILLDWMLPDLDGPVVLQALRTDKATKDIPVVMLTARADASDERSAWEQGVSDYVTKPFERGRLLATVEAALAPSEREDAATRRTRALNRLRASDTEVWQRLAAIVQNCDEPIIGKTLDGTITSWNPAAERLYGYSADEVIGRPISLLAPPDQADEITDLLARLARGEPIEDFETVRQHRDGRLIHVSLSVSPIRDASGAVTGASTIVRDLTDRRQKNARFRALVETAPDAMVIVCTDGTIELVNSQLERLFGYDRSELIGQPLEILVPPRFRARHGVLRAGYFEAPQVRPMGSGLDLYGLRKDGTEFPVEISLSPLQTEERTTVSATIRDITERKRFEGARALALLREREASRQLREINRLRSGFLAAVSHELRTPLTVIRGLTEILSNDWNQIPEPQKVDLLGRIGGASTRLDSLVCDLLDFIRLERGELTLAVEPQPLAPLVEAVRQRAAPLLGEHQLSVAVDDDLVVMADPAAFGRVLEHLLSNAAKFSSAGSTIALSARAEDRAVAISVADSGPGIPLEETDKIFERFYRVGGVTNRLPGTGIGLAIVKGLTEAQGGRVEVTSTEGVGSTFTVHLPSP